MRAFGLTMCRLARRHTTGSMMSSVAISSRRARLALLHLKYRIYASENGQVRPKYRIQSAKPAFCI